MTNHSSVEQLSVYLDDQLDEPERRRLEGHLAECEDCRRRCKGSSGWREPHHRHT
jgi:anti-sigma factor RsiW